MSSSPTGQSSSTTAVILAAGKGTRMKSELPKVATTLAGRPLLLHVIDALRAAGVKRVVPVVGFKREVVQAIIPPYTDLKVEFALQEEQKGTAHALQCAEPLFSNYEGDLLVACGDMPLIRAETFAALLQYHHQQQSYATVLSAHQVNPTGYGRIVRDGNGSLHSIVEEKDASDDIRKISEVNTGTYIFRAPAVFEALRKVGSSNAQREFYLPDVIAIFREEGRPVAALQIGDADESLGCNSVEDLTILESKLKERNKSGKV